MLESGGGYFFRFAPNVIAASTSINNAIVSVMLIGVTSFGMYLAGSPPPSLAWLDSSTYAWSMSSLNFNFGEDAQNQAQEISVIAQKSKTKGKRGENRGLTLLRWGAAYAVAPILA